VRAMPAAPALPLPPLEVHGKRARRRPRINLVARLMSRWFSGALVQADAPDGCGSGITMTIRRRRAGLWNVDRSVSRCEGRCAERCVARSAGRCEEGCGGRSVPRNVGRRLCRCVHRCGTENVGRCGMRCMTRCAGRNAERSGGDPEGRGAERCVRRND